jgi:hypothetical protein
MNNKRKMKKKKKVLGSKANSAFFFLPLGKVPCLCFTSFHPAGTSG